MRRALLLFSYSLCLLGCNSERAVQTDADGGAQLQDGGAQLQDGGADAIDNTGPCTELNCGTGRCEATAAGPKCVCEPGAWFSVAKGDCVACAEVTDTIAIEVRGVEVTPEFTYDGQPLVADEVAVVWLRAPNASAELRSGTTSVIQPGRYRMFSDESPAAPGPYKRAGASFYLGDIEIKDAGTYNVNFPKLHRNSSQLNGLLKSPEAISLTHESGQRVLITRAGGTTDVGIASESRFSFYGPAGEYTVESIDDRRPEPYTGPPQLLPWHWTDAEKAQPAWGRFSIPEGGTLDPQPVGLETYEVTLDLKFRGQSVGMPIALVSPRGHFAAVYASVDALPKVIVPKGTYHIVPNGNLNVDGKRLPWRGDVGAIEVSKATRVDVDIPASLITATVTLNGQPFALPPASPQPSLTAGYLAPDGTLLGGPLLMLNREDGTIELLAKKGERVQFSQGLGLEFNRSAAFGKPSIFVIDQDKMQLAFDVKTSAINVQLVTAPLEGAEGFIGYRGYTGAWISATQHNQLPLGEYLPYWDRGGRAPARYFFDPITISLSETQLTLRLPLRRLTASVTYVGESIQTPGRSMYVRGPNVDVALFPLPNAPPGPFTDLLLPAGRFEVWDGGRGVVGCVKIKPF